MKATYDDILERVGATPDWFDENGTPRFGAFTPRALPDIYADECVLLEVACADCRARFKVAMSTSSSARMIARARGVEESQPGERDLAEAIARKWIGYGDPPRAGHRDECVAGATMSSDTERVIEYHRRAPGGPWRRDHALEIHIETVKETA